MKGIFTNYVSTVKRGLLNDFKASVQSTPLQGVLNSLNKFRQKIQNDQGATDSLVAALTVDSSLINDDIAEGNAIDPDQSYLSVIDEDIADDVIDSVKLAINKDADGTGRGLTLSDGQGNVFNLLNYSGPALDNGDVPIITNSLHPRSAQDCLIFRRQSVCYLNNLLVSSDYFRPTPGTSTTALENIQAAELLIAGSASSSILIALSNICDQLGVSYSASGSISDLLDALSVSGSTLLERSYNLYLARYPLYGRGRITSLWNLLHSQIESVSINEAISDVCSLLLSSKDYAAGLAAIASNYSSSKYSSVSQFSRGVNNAYNTGGLYAAASYILSYANSASTMTVDDDGVMHFSDNSSLIPQQYIAGLVSNFIGTALTLIGVVASAFSKVVGALLSGIGQIITAPFRAASYDYEQNTKAQLITDDDVVIPIAPHALFKITTGIPLYDENSYTSLSQAFQLVYDTKGIAYAPIPGGYAIIGPGSFTEINNEKVVHTYNIEFHPEIIGKSVAFRTVASHLFSKANTSGIEDTYNISFSFSTHNLPEDLLQYGRDLANMWNQTAPDVQVLDNGTTEDGGQGQTGVLSDKDDKQVRKWITQNIIIMDLYLHCMMNEHTSYDCICQYTPSFIPGHSNWRKAEINGTKVLNGLQEVTHDGASQLGCALLACLDEDLGSWEESSLTYFITNTDSQYQTEQLAVLSWAKLGEYVVLPKYEYSNYNFWQFCCSTWLLDDAVTFSSNVKFSLKTPKYDRGTFWFWVAVSGVLTVGVLAATVAVTLKVRKSIQKRRAINQANVEASWSQLTDDPTPESYANYRKAVRKNNNWAHLIGGTRYDYVNYWGGGDSSAMTDSVANIFTPVSGDTADNEVTNQSSTLDLLGVDGIKTLITGS